jgi:hypothetical protein
MLGLKLGVPVNISIFLVFSIRGSNDKTGLAKHLSKSRRQLERGGGCI